VYISFVTKWHNAWKTYNIKIRNCVLLRYGTVQSKWSAQTMWPGPTAFIMMAYVDSPRMFLQNIHNHVFTRLHGVLTQTTLQILTTVSTSNTMQKISKNWNVDGKVTLGKLNYIWTVYTFTQYLTSHTFPTDCTLFYIVSQKLRKQTIFNINTHFTISTTYGELQTSTTIMAQGNLTSDCKIQQRIWKWKDKEDCSVSAVPYVILIMWMTVTTT